MTLKNTIKYCSYLFLILLSNLSFAQQDALFTNYMYNTNIFNPAYTGTREVISIYGMHRSQWAGLDGAPSTSVFSFQSPLNSNLSFGLNFINDQVGPSDENNLSVDFAYRFPISETNYISFGVKTTANLFNVDYRKLNIEDGTDIEFQNKKEIPAFVVEIVALREVSTIFIDHIDMFLGSEGAKRRTVQQIKSVLTAFPSVNIVVSGLDSDVSVLQGLDGCTLHCAQIFSLKGFRDFNEYEVFFESILARHPRTSFTDVSLEALYNDTKGNLGNTFLRLFHPAYRYNGRD